MQKMSLKESLLSNKNLMPLKLHLFTEGDNPGAGADDNGGTGELGGGDPPSGEKGNGPLSFATESERDNYFDKLLAKTKWEAETQTKIEAEKMSQMTVAQKAEHEEQERLKKINEREQILLAKSSVLNHWRN